MTPVETSKADPTSPPCSVDLEESVDISHTREELKAWPIVEVVVSTGLPPCQKKSPFYLNPESAICCWLTEYSSTYYNAMIRVDLFNFRKRQRRVVSDTRASSASDTKKTLSSFFKLKFWTPTQWWETFTFFIIGKLVKGLCPRNWSVTCMPKNYSKSS